MSKERVTYSLITLKRRKCTLDLRTGSNTRSEGEEAPRGRKGKLGKER